MTETSGIEVATLDPSLATTSARQGHCAHCGMHITFDNAGKWVHTMAGIYPCRPAWRPRGHLRAVSGR